MHIPVTTFLIFPNLLTLLFLSQFVFRDQQTVDTLTKKFVILTKFLQALQCGPACPVHGGTCITLSEPLFMLFNFTLKNRKELMSLGMMELYCKLKMPMVWSDPPLEPSFSMQKIKNVEASIIATSTTPIMLTLHASIGSTATL
jgi:hypothetical protein